MTADVRGARGLQTPGLKTRGSIDDIDAVVRTVIHDIARQNVTHVGRDDDLVGVLGVDSLQGLQILAGVEKRFGIRLPDETLIHLRTIGRIVDAVSDAIQLQEETRVS